MSNYLLLDGDAIQNAFKAGGIPLVDQYLNFAESRGFTNFVMTDFVFEFELNGFVGVDHLKNYLGTRGMVVATTAEAELARRFNAGLNPGYVKTNGGERSLVEVATKSTKSTSAFPTAWRAQEDQMTVFRDITGWREELDELRNGPVYQAMYPKPLPGGVQKKAPLVPVSAILDFTETLLLNAETREALTIRDKWYEDHPLGDRTHYDINELDSDPTFPHDESNLLLRDFPRWYILKTGFGPRDHVYHHGCSLASQILRGNIPNVRSEQARQYLMDVTNAYSVDHSK